jgi:hypothetical protein
LHIFFSKVPLYGLEAAFFLKKAANHARQTVSGTKASSLGEEKPNGQNNEDQFVFSDLFG